MMLSGSSYESGKTSNMAEEISPSHLEEIKTQIQRLSSRYSGDDIRADSESFCCDFCKLVEEYTAHWQVPLSRLRILQIALCYFAEVSTFFTPNCDHVQQTISRLALSIFELLLFFDQKEFNQNPVKDFTAAFQECYLTLTNKFENVHLLQVERLVQGGGPWASPALQGILRESTLPQTEVEACIRSELPVFLELRVCFLLSHERVVEAMALAKSCLKHLVAGQHLFFLQLYLSWLYKTSQQGLLLTVVSDVNGKDAVHVICNLECEEKDELLLDLSTAFLSEQLSRGDMYYLCDLVFVWTNLHRRLKTSKQAFQEACHQLMLGATNIKAIFPFIRAILQEVGEDGIQFCVELCAHALRSRLPCDVVTKCLIYKTVAGLLPDDLEVCRACALLVFFLERSIESYKMVYLLYMHPDQEYHVDDCIIRNNVRFEMLQVLKKDLQFDPEFWNLIALRSSCIKLMNEKVLSAALEEIMEDRWIPKFFTNGPFLQSRASAKDLANKQHHKQDSDIDSKRLKMVEDKKQLNNHTGRRKCNQASQKTSGALRRSFWQLDRMCSSNEEHRRITRLSVKNPPKRKIRQPKWLLQDSGRLEQNLPLKVNKNMLKGGRHIRSSVLKPPEHNQNNKHKPLINSYSKTKENEKLQNGEPVDDSLQTNTPQVILELSQPDNELIGSFTDEASLRLRGNPPVLFYKQTLKLPQTARPAKSLYGKEVILRARDFSMFVQLQHCYTRRQKGNGTGSNLHSSVSTITRSSVHGSSTKDSPEKSEIKAAKISPAKLEKVSKTETIKSPPKTSARELSERSADKLNEITDFHQACSSESTEKVSQTIKCIEAQPELSAVETSSAHNLPPTQGVSVAREPYEEPAVEMKVTIASQSAILDHVSKAPAEQVSKVQSAEMTTSNNIKKATSDNHMVCINANVPDTSSSLHSLIGEEYKSIPSSVKGGDGSIHTTSSLTVSDVSFKHVPCENNTSPAQSPNKPSETNALCSHKDEASTSDSKTLLPGTISELLPEKFVENQITNEPLTPCCSKDSEEGSTSKDLQQTQTPSSCSATKHAALDDTQEENDLDEDSAPETEESKLDFCCTFCNKQYKGGQVVSHAMFHFRRDECMFCKMIFKDDLLAMMHLSDHIETLKRIKDKENEHADSRSTAGAKTLPKSKTVNTPVRGRGRPRKSSISPKPQSRMLRSNVSGALSQEEESETKSPGDQNSILRISRVNGHIGKKKLMKSKLDPEKKPRKQDIVLKQEREEDIRPSLEENKGESSAENNERKMGFSQVLKMPFKQNEDVIDDKNTEFQEQVYCPMDGCSWSMDLTKNRVAVLYHALQDHCGEVEPLELAFRVGKQTCRICMRVLWSFEHFLHHVERHKRLPRHPCLHKGCTARFKSANEMRRHTRKHNPLQAECCVPGCSKVFICLWALNLHEREHYGPKFANPHKSNSLHKDEKKLQTSETITPRSTKPTKESREGPVVEKVQKDSNNLASTSASNLTSRASLKTRFVVEKEQKDSKNLTNLSNKDTTAQPTVQNLRLCRTAKQSQAKNSTSKAPKGRKVTSASLLNRQQRLLNRSKVKKKIEEKQKKENKRLKTKVNFKRLKNVENTKSNQKLSSKTRRLLSESGVKKKKIQKEEDDFKTTEVDSNSAKNKQIPGNRISKPQVKNLNHSGSSQLKTTSSVKEKLSQLHRRRQTFLDSRKTKNHKILRRKIKKNAVMKNRNQNLNKCSTTKKTSKPKSTVVKLESEVTAVEISEDERRGANESTENVCNTSRESMPNSGLSTDEHPDGKRKDTLKKLVSKEETSQHGTTSDFDKEEKTKRKWSKKQGDTKEVINQVKECKTSILTKMAELKNVIQQDETKDEPPHSLEETRDEKTSDFALSKPATIVSQTSDVSDTNNIISKSTNKRKVVDEDDAKRIVRKLKDRVQAAKKSANVVKVKPPSESSAPDTSPTTKLIQTENGQVSTKTPKPAENKESRVDFKKRPYRRPPPTAYLDEKFITMPKKRKERLVCLPSDENSSLDEDLNIVVVQRHCTRCFMMFNSTEELQNHLQLQKCSNFFGFDSDDEGNG